MVSTQSSGEEKDSLNIVGSYDPFSNSTFHYLTLLQTLLESKRLSEHGGQKYVILDDMVELLVAHKLSSNVKVARIFLFLIHLKQHANFL